METYFLNIRKLNVINVVVKVFFLNIFPLMQLCDIIISD
jgi:hypothetical protein